MKVIVRIILVLVLIGSWFIFWVPDAETKRSAILVKDFRSKLELLNSMDVLKIFDSLDECDVILEFKGEDQHPFGNSLPQGSKGFIVKFCEGTEFEINDSPPPNSLIGVVGLAFGERDLSNRRIEKTIHVYAPTNGTDSIGDAVIGVWRYDQHPSLREWFPTP